MLTYLFIEQRHYDAEIISPHCFICTELERENNFILVSCDYHMIMVAVDNYKMRNTDYTCVSVAFNIICRDINIV